MVLTIPVSFKSRFSNLFMVLWFSSKNPSRTMNSNFELCFRMQFLRFSDFFNSARISKSRWWSLKIMITKILARRRWSTRNDSLTTSSKLKIIFNAIFEFIYNFSKFCSTSSKLQIKPSIEIFHSYPKGLRDVINVNDTAAWKTQTWHRTIGKPRALIPIWRNSLKPESSNSQ